MPGGLIHSKRNVGPPLGGSAAWVSISAPMRVQPVKRRRLPAPAPLRLLLALLLTGASACGARDEAARTPGPPSAEEAASAPAAAGWRMADDDSLTPEQRYRIDQLVAIGYLSGSRKPAGRGVTLHDPRRSQAGLNFFTSGHAPEALLMDMDGRVLHRWRFDFSDAWPNPRRLTETTGYWRRAHLFENGDILAIFEGLGMLKLDRDSNLLWARPGGEHHDLDVLPNGDIYVLTRVAHLVPRIHESEPILEDFVSVLDRDGNEKRRVSLLEAFENSPFRHLVFQGKRSSGDIFHTNTIRVLDGRIADRVPEFARGRVLTSMNALRVIAVVDLERERVVWAHKGDFIGGQHDPKVLPNGNVLLFDNVRGRRMSSVMELEPATMETLWEYRGTPQRPFVSPTCGAADRLENGNTLITESDGGRAFEVTPAGEIVWEFYNPHSAGPNDEYIATLFELVRLPETFPTDWLGDPAS